MKSCILQISEPLATLINYSFHTGHVPDSIKIAKVCPIYKGGDKNVFSNYRPISVLPSFSKIYEKAVFNRLWNYIDKNSLIVNIIISMALDRLTRLIWLFKACIIKSLIHWINMILLWVYLLT
jgi:hypothetical protein